MSISLELHKLLDTTLNTYFVNSNYTKMWTYLALQAYKYAQDHSPMAIDPCIGQDLDDKFWDSGKGATCGQSWNPPMTHVSFFGP